MPPERQPAVILTDTASDLPQEVALRENVNLITVPTLFKGELVPSTKKLLEIMLTQKDEIKNDGNGILTTSAPSPGDFIKTYKALPGKRIISIHIGSEYSGTYDSSLVATRELSEKEDGYEIANFDTGTVSMAVGFLAIEAVKNSHKTNDEIVNLLVSMKDRIITVCTLNTLQFAQSGGRVVRFAGDILGVKPILNISRNRPRESLVTEKTRGRKKSVEKLIDIVKKQTPLEKVAIIHVDAEKEAEQLANEITAFYEGDIVLTEAGAAIARHGGPGVLGICAIKEKPDKLT